MGCCHGDEPQELPDGIRPCFGVRGRRCVCLPYDDGLLVASQILSIAALLVSWTWWVTLLVGLLATVGLQVLWCCRYSPSVLRWVLLPPLVASLLSLGTGICRAMAQRDAHLCDFREWEPFPLWSRRDDGSCRELVGAGAAILGGILWATVAGCLWQFIRSGRHARWEALHARTQHPKDEETASAATASATAVAWGLVPEAPAENNNTKTEEHDTKSTASVASVASRSGAAPAADRRSKPRGEPRERKTTYVPPATLAGARGDPGGYTARIATAIRYSELA